MKPHGGPKGFLAWVRRHIVGWYVALGFLWLLLSLYYLVLALTGSGTTREWFGVYINAFLAALAWVTALLTHRARRKSKTDGS